MAFELHSSGASNPLRPFTQAITFSIIVALGAGCLFTSPINMPPTITAINTPLHVWHNQDAVFTASTQDPDGNSVAVWFAYAPGDCAQSPPPPQKRVLLTDPNAPFRVPETGRWP